MKMILSVDDSPSIRQMIAFTLENAGYRVVPAANGEEALALAQSQPCHLVITDQNMPGMDGLSLIRALRALPDYRQVPILMLTTESGEQMKAAGRAAGATGWLVKPFEPRRLVEVVQRVLP
ncbi:response regulator [Chitiniphilus purpureus]|uniref:Response regulator n=1 Tax=Chitiniphilus purpureus TaxID=2981137 RepID=A0ABY6DHX3_9NEIS|nr:response regulator [Chitiniphilus sp. CD1]UXY13949.1 response regulator [Chitiniphilus sp. CD1]